MKKINIILLFLILGIISHSQENTNIKNYKNEISVDATILLKQFFFFNSSQYYNFSGSPVYLLYRRNLHNFNIRSGFGGTYWSEENTPNDTTVNNREIAKLDFRIGIERQTNIGKKMFFFYGLDIWTNYSTNKNDRDYQNGGQTVGADTQENQYGFSPLLGFRFNLSNRISISTSGNMSFYYYKSISKKIYKPDDSLNTKSTNEGYNVDYNPLAFIFVSYHF